MDQDQGYENLVQIIKSEFEGLKKTNQEKFEELNRVNAIVLSELQLLKQGIIIIGGKAVSDLYGITETTKNDWQTEAQAFAVETTPEEMAEFVQECHENPKVREEAVKIGELAKAWNPSIKNSEIAAFGKWVSIQWLKMFGVRPTVQLDSRVGARKQSKCYYPQSSKLLLDSMAAYFFGERTDIDGQPPARMY